MTEDPSGNESDEEPADGNGDSERSSSAREESATGSDPFDETFIVKETEETDPSPGNDDELSTGGNSWIDEAGVDESPRSGKGETNRTAEPGDEQSDDEWGRIPIDLTRGDDHATEPWDASTRSDENDDAHRPEPSSTPVVPGDPSLEGAVFVVLGAIAMILVMFRLTSVVLG